MHIPRAGVFRLQIALLTFGNISQLRRHIERQHLTTKFHVYIVYFELGDPVTTLGIDQRWNLKNLSRGLNSPKSAKTRFKAPA